MLKIFIIFVLFYALFLLLAFKYQHHLLFFPDSTPFVVCPLPENGQVIKKGNIKYYLFSKPDAKGTLIHFHGNAGRACDRLFVWENLNKLPINIVLAEYPGYSESKTKINQNLILENAQILFDDFKDQKVIIFGESLGSAVATYLSSKNKVEGLILQSPFTSIAEVGQKAYPFFPVKLILKNPFPSMEWIKSVKAPILFLHGTKDKIVPISLARKLYGFVKDNAEFKEFYDREHNDITFQNKIFWESIEQFIKESL